LFKDHYVLAEVTRVDEIGTARSTEEGLFSVPMACGRLLKSCPGFRVFIKDVSCINDKTNEWIFANIKPSCTRFHQKQKFDRVNGDFIFEVQHLKAKKLCEQNN